MLKRGFSKKEIDMVGYLNYFQAIKNVKSRG
jgi:hypothetical protein